MEAVENPVKRPVDESKLARRPKALRAKGKSFTVPESDDTTEQVREVPEKRPKEESKELTAHTEIQWLLLKLGSDMGLDVWVARNDVVAKVMGVSLATSHD